MGRWVRLVTHSHARLNLQSLVGKAIFPVMPLIHLLEGPPAPAWDLSSLVQAEAAVLFFLTPSLLGGHLLGILSHDVESGLLAATAATLAVFAARKWTQPIKADIGDKSVFM